MPIVAAELAVRDGGEADILLALDGLDDAGVLDRTKLFLGDLAGLRLFARLGQLFGTKQAPDLVSPKNCVGLLIVRVRYSVVIGRP